MDWFRKLIESESESIGKNHGWKSKLARRCGVSPATITDWLNHGKNPDAFTAFSVLKKLGGDIERALPGWSPESHDTSLPCAKIRAGTESYVPEVDAEICDPMPAIWRQKKCSQPH